MIRRVAVQWEEVATCHVFIYADGVGLLAHVHFKVHILLEQGLQYHNLPLAL